jgi:hypothetical protein
MRRRRNAQTKLRHTELLRDLGSERDNRDIRPGIGIDRVRGIDGSRNPPSFAPERVPLERPDRPAVFAPESALVVSGEQAGRDFRIKKHKLIAMAEGKEIFA